MLPDRTSFRTTFARVLRQALPWALALAVATCADDQSGPSHGGTGYFGFRPVYGISGTLSQFGIVADSVHIRLTRPVNQVVLDTVVFFPADSSQLHLVLPVALESSPETLTAVIGISSGPTMLFTDSLDVSVVDGPPSVANIPVVLLTYVGPGKNVAAITLLPGDTTIVLRDTLFFSATAVDTVGAAVASFFVGWKTSDTTVAKINGAGRLIAPNLRGSVKVIGTTPTGIADTTNVVFAPVPTQILADSGDLQSGLVADSLGALFVAKVLASDNLGVSGIAVRWTAVKPGGVVRDTLLFTDAQGRVKTRGVLGDSVATYTYTATVVGTAITRTFSATATAAAASAIATISGDLQSDSAGRALPAPLTVRVTDAFGNPVTGAKVYWTRVFGSGTVAADSNLTNASGLASTGFTLGAVGTDSVTAALAGTSAFVQFSATAINGAPATATKVFGDTQTAAVGQLLTDSLAVVVKSATNFPVVGAPVVWTVLRGGATSPDTAFTDINGRAAVAYTLGTLAGSDSVKAQAGAVAATFTATAQAAAPTAIAIFSGNGQVDTANRALPQPLVVAVTDAFGNAVLGAPVTFTRIAGHGHVGSDTVTSVADNHPASTYTFGSIPGTDSIRVTLLANGATVTFAESSINATPASVIEIHGNGISTLVGTAFSDSLIVQILDNNDDPIALQQVIWTVTSGTGSVALDTVLTDSLGFAVQHVTAGSSAGTLVVNAKVVAPISQVNFSLNLNAGVATAIALVSGDAQTDTTGKILPLPLQVHVTDALGNPIAGAQVAWATVAGAGHPNNDTTLTDISGNSQVAYTLGALATTDSVKATLVGTSAFVQLTETSISAAATGIIKLLGDAQVDTVLSTLTDSLVVSLRDGGNNPIANTWLYWTQIPGAVTLSADSTKTDVNGRAAVQATFGAVASTYPVLVRNIDTTVATVFLETAHPGVLTQITKTQGDAQTGAVSAPLPIDFGVVVQDAHGNLALPGTAVTWTDLHGFTPAGLPDTTVTDSFGIAKLTAPLPGPIAGEDSLVAQILGGTAADTFTVTATAGAAASLVYVSGTGQTDTVSALLATPLIVQARDAASNPVAGVYVHFTRTSGTGLVLSDSALTDGAGAAQTLYSMGTVAGRDSIIATLANSPDTVAFYNVSTPGAAKTMVIVSGDSQAVAVSSALPAPFVVRIADQFGNPIQGPSVAFDTVGTGATIAGTPAATDAAGLATTGTVTLGASAGSFTFPATTSSLPGDTVFFTAVALPIGTSKQWLGTLSSNWGTAGNWSPAVIPSSADNIFVPVSAPNQPLLDAARSVGGIQVESGASVSLSTFNLTVLGNAQVDGTVNRTSGLMILSAAAGTAQGNLAGVRVTGNVTLNGTTVVGDSLQLTAGSLVIGGQRLTVTGALSITGGAFTMQNAADSVTVTGATLYNGATTAGLLSAGTLVLQGNFSEPSGSAVFQGSGTHTTVFNGPAAQTVTFAASSLAGNRLGNAVFANSNGITLGGNISVAGTAAVTAGVVTGAGRTAFLGGDLSDPTSLGWDVATTSLAGTPTLLPDSILGNLDVTGTVALAKPLVVKGNLTPNGSSVLSFGGFGVRVDGSMTVSGAAQVTMLSASDSLDVAGAISWNGSTTAGLLSAGTIVARGASFSAPSGSSTFQPSGSHRVVFAGSALQTWSSGNSGVAGDRFQEVDFANAAGVTFGSNVYVTGTAHVLAGTVTGTGRTVTLGGTMIDSTSVAWQPTTTVYTGTPATLPDSFVANVNFAGSTVTLAKDLTFKGTADFSGAGATTLNGFTLRADSTLTISGSHQVILQNAADTVDAEQALVWNGSTTAGLVNSGVIIARGDFSAPSGSSTFQPSGSNRVVFAGSAAQSWSSGNSGPAGDRFQDVDFASAVAVDFGSNVYVTGTATVLAGNVTGVGRTVTFGGTLVDSTSVAWQPTTTVFTGTPASLPDSFVHNLQFSASTVTLAKDLAVHGTLVFSSSGSMTLNGFNLRVDSSLSVLNTFNLVLQNAADTLEAMQDVTWNGGATAGLINNGVIIVRGNMTAPSGSTTFQPSGSNKVVFAGAAAQSWSSGNSGPAGDRFQDVDFASAVAVDFGSNVYVTGQARVLSGTVTGVGRTVTLAGVLIDSTSVAWQPTTTAYAATPASLPDSFARNVQFNASVALTKPLAILGNLSTSGPGALAPNGFVLRVDSALSITGSYQLLMQNPADTVDVHGTFTINGSTTAGLLTAGTLILHGDFSEPSGSAVFRPSGTHATVFKDSVTHTVTFAATSAAGNRFNDLRLEGPTVLALGNDLFVNGSLVTPTGSPVTVGSTAGVRLVTTRGLTLSTVTFDSVRVSYSGGLVTFLNDVTFQHQDPTTVQFALAEAGSATPEGLGRMKFLTTPTTGKYLSATDTLANGIPLVVKMFSSFPLDGTAFEQEVAGNDGATIAWSSFGFVLQPTGGGVLGILDSVWVALKGPDGNPDATFTGNISIALGANPGGATLGGTTTLAATLGYVKFGDLTLSAAGFGYTFVVSTAGIAPDTSTTFDISVPLPAGFTTQWTGVTSSDWFTGSNWSTGLVPDSTTDVYISAVSVNSPLVTSGVPSVNRILVDSGATLAITGGIFSADSSVEVIGAITGGGTVELLGSGDLRGTIDATVGVHGPYAISGPTAVTGNLAVLDSTGVLTVSTGDTVSVGGLLNVNIGGRLVMNDATAQVDVTGAADFFGASETGSLTLGTLRVAGDLTAGGPNADAYAPDAGHLTVLNGTTLQTVDFPSPDSVTGSHFGRLQVSTAGTALMAGRYDALGDITVTTGATLADSQVAGFEAHGFTSVDAGGTLDVNNLRTRGGIGVAVGGTYSVATTTYYEGTAFPINPAPYDTLVLQMDGVASGDFSILGDLRISGSGAGFDLNGHSVTVGGSVTTENGAHFRMTNAADALNVTGGFFANGGSTAGLLTAGTLQIGGDFHQTGDVSGEAFRADAGHTTRFTGGAGPRQIEFDNPSNGPGDLTGSHFGTLDLATGVDTVKGRVAAQAIVIGGSVTMDTTGFGNGLASYGNVDILGTSDSIHLQALQLFGALTRAGSGSYQVGTTAYLGGGGTLPHLPYTDLAIVNATYVLGDSQTVAGNISLGQAAGEIGPPAQPGTLIAGGFDLLVGGTLGTQGLGLFTMASGDSVDVGAADFRGGNSAGHFTGGTLVVRGMFNAQGTSPFMADAAHTTVLAATSPATLYTSSDSSRFGKLVVLDADLRRLGGGGFDLEVLDSLIIGSSTTGITDTIGFGSVPVWVHGPVFTVAGSGIALRSSFEVDSTLAVAGSYAADVTIFGGHNILIPTLPYTNVTVTGTATLTDSLILPGGALLTIGGGGLPADLTMAGHVARMSQFRTTEFGALTMTNAADTLDASLLTSFDGASEVGKITNGVILVHGSFNQGNASNDSTFFATGFNEVRFTDSTASVDAAMLSMTTGASRFHDVVVTGKGVNFTGGVWIAGNASIVSPTIDSVSGGMVTVGGLLSDAGPTAHAWNVDTTVFLINVASMPDSIGGGAIFENGLNASDSIRIGGFARSNNAAFNPNGHTVRVHGALDIAGTGFLAMLGAQDSLFVDSTLTISGASVGSSNLAAGDLQIGGSLVVSATAGFWASGSHRTYLYGAGTRVVDFGAPGNVLRDFAYSDGTELTTDLAIQGNLTGPGETPGVLYGVDSLLQIGGTVQQGVVFNNVRVAVGESNPLFDVSFQGMDPARTQVTVSGAGQVAPVDLSVIRFATLPTTGHFVDAVDTLPNGDSLVVRMIGSTPLQGTAFSAGTGEGAVRWGKLVFTTLPITVDSLIPFTVIVAAQGPDGLNYNQNSLDISLGANPAGDVLGGTLSQGFLFGLATFPDLALTKTATGVSFTVAVQHGANDSTVALDTATSAPFTVFNPAPLGAIIFDGDALDGLWSSAANWSTDIVPSENDSIFVPGNTVVTYDIPNDTIGTLVLGSGATLNLGFGDTLVAFGRVTAGNTIAGSGVLQLAGAIQPISGTLPSTLITGTVVATGHTAINGSLTIDGAAAEFNVGGAHIDISNSLTTQNGGLLTMDGLADTVYVADVNFAGGDETGRLTDGVLLIQGFNFDQGFGDPNSFHASGNHTTIFGNGGSATAVNISTPANSQFAHVKVQNPNGVDLNESGQDFVRISGDLTVSAGGLVTGDTIRVDGTATSGVGDSIGAAVLQVGGALAVTGGYFVPATMFIGTDQTIPGLPFQDLYLADSNATLGANVLAVDVFAQSGLLHLGGHTLHAQVFRTQFTGRLMMDSPIDSLIADTAALFQGSSQKGFLSAGVVALGGDLFARGNRYQADPGHVTRFFGATPHAINMGLSCEGSCPQPPLEFGLLEVDTGSVLILDSNNDGVQVWDTLRLASGVLLDAGHTILAQGPVVADAPSYLKVGVLDVHDSVAIAVDDTAYQVTNTVYSGLGQVVTPLPYQTLTFAGSSTSLQARTTAAWVDLVGAGELALVGHTLVADSQFTADSASHLLMHDPLDSLLAPQYAVFKADSTEGDLTDGVILAHHFIQQVGVTGGDRGFVQTGTNRLVPVAGDTIEMTPTGPAGSRLGFLDLTGAGGMVTFGNVWVTDSLVNSDPSIQTQTLTGADNFVVQGNVHWTAGLLHLDTLAVGGTLTVDSLSSTYQVTLTKFIGTAQTVPADVPYTDIQVYYPAVLGGDIHRGPATMVMVLNSGDLDLNGHSLDIRVFQTQGQGVLTMTHAADTLLAWDVIMEGGNTAGHLTAGVIETYDFSQFNINDDSSYAPSGTHAMDLVDWGPPSESGPRIHTSSAEFNILHIRATGTGPFDKPKLFNDITVRDTFAVYGNLDATFNSVQTGSAVFGPGSNTSLSQLTIHDTLIVDPAATYGVGGTIFAAGAATIPGGMTFADVAIEGVQTLTSPFTTATNLYVRAGGVLTPNGQIVNVGGTLAVQDSAHLVMANANDTLQASVAVFDGASTSGQLTAGVLRISNVFQQFSTHSDSSFVSTGTAVEFYGSSYHTVDFASPGLNRSRFHGLTLLDGENNTAFNTPATVTGPVTVNDGTAIVTGGDGAAVDFYGPVTATSNGQIQNNYLGLLTFHNALTMANPGNYYVINTAFAGVNEVPNLPYQYLYLQDGVHDTLSHDLNVQNTLVLYASANGLQDLVFHNHTVTAGGFNTQQLGRFTMKNNGDTLNINGDATFAGSTLANRLIAGQIRFGGNVTQDASTSLKSFRADGTRLLFDGGGDATQNVTFATSSTTTSYLGKVYLADGGSLNFNSSITVEGGMEMEFGTYLNVPNSSTFIDIFGGMILGDGATVNASDPSIFMNFSGPVTRTSYGASWNVANTGLSQSNVVPDLSYTNLFLGDLTHDTLTTNINVSGILTLSSLNPNAQDLVLAGHTLRADSLVVSDNARLTMNDPNDSLFINTGATFGGASLSGRLTAGLLSIAGGLTQTSTTSDKSFRADGTVTEFRYVGSQHFLSFDSPDSSYFGRVQPDGGNNLPLASFSGFTVKGTLDGGTILGLVSNAKVTADTILLGSTPGSAVVNLPHLRTRSIAGAFAPFEYTVPVTEFFGHGEILALPYDTLLVGGNDSLVTGSATATWVNIPGQLDVASAATLHATKVVSVTGTGAQLRMSGGSVAADSLFATSASGTLRADSGGVNTRDASFGGGATTGLLTGGALNVTGNFEQLGAGTFSFDADSTFTVAINGGGQHAIAIADPVNTKFGTLLLEGSSFQTDTTTFPAATIVAYRLATNNDPVIIGTGGGSQLDMATLEVSGLADSGVRIHQSSTTGQPLNFNDVTFRGFSATDVQLSITHPGTGILDPTHLDNIDFDNAANPDGVSGFFVKATDSNGLATFLNLQIFGPDSGIGASLTALLSGALVGWFPPT